MFANRRRLHPNRESARYADAMGPSPLTLAALASAAAPSITIVGSEPWPSDGEHEGAVLTTADGGKVLVRVPVTPLAEVRRVTEGRTLSAFTPAVRERLPFALPEILGEERIGDAHVVVSRILAGEPLHLHQLRPGETLAMSIGHSLAALHSLPVSVVAEAGLPLNNPGECLRASVAVLDRAESTGLVPAALLERWDRVLTTGELWQFPPSVIHAALSPELVLVENDIVVGMTDWGSLQVGDPASDLAWLLAGTAPGVTETAFDAYWVARQVPVDREFRIRARFYAELELAKWLLHGQDVDDADIVEDAIQMLTALEERVADEPAPLVATTSQPLGLDEVRAMLSQQHPSIYAPAPRAASTPSAE